MAKFLGSIIDDILDFQASFYALWSPCMKMRVFLQLLIALCIYLDRRSDPYILTWVSVPSIEASAVSIQVSSSLR